MKLQIDNNSLLHKCFDLFKNKKNICSEQSNTHFKKMKNLITKKYNESDWKNYICANLLNNQLLTNDNNNIDEILDNNNLKFSPNFYRVVFINGFYSLKLSDNNIGNWILNIEDKKFFKNPITPEFFFHLNEIFAKKNICVRLSKEKSENKPLCLIHINKSNNTKSDLYMNNYCHNIHMENNTKGCVFEYFVNISSDNSYFTCTNSSMNIESNVDFQYVKFIIQDENNCYFSNNDFFIKGNSVVRSNVIILGSGFTKHSDNIQFKNKKSRMLINNLLLSSKMGTNEIHSYIEHNKNECISNQTHRTLAFKSSKNSFNGIIKISSNTHENDAKMLNNNFLVGNLSKIHTEPKLEIYSENVQCSHGATIGKINKEQVFYICSRGIPVHTAIYMILFSICKETIQTINKIELENMILTYIKQFLKEEINELSYSKNTI